MYTGNPTRIIYMDLFFKLHLLEFITRYFSTNVSNKTMGLGGLMNKFYLTVSYIKYNFVRPIYICIYTKMVHLFCD